MNKFDLCGCHKCKHFKYNGKYDSYFCNLRNIWFDSKCSDKNCGYCKEKPEYPDVKKHKKDKEDLKKTIREWMQRQSKVQKSIKKMLKNKKRK